MKLSLKCFKFLLVLFLSSFLFSCNSNNDDMLKYSLSGENGDEKSKEDFSNAVEVKSDSSIKDNVKEKVIIVHVSGNVKRSGVYDLNSGDRVIDAINKAGGFTNEADSDAINLAEKVKDGMKIYVPQVGEVVKNERNDGSGNYIDLNLATKEELMTLPGVGEKTADKIIDYRNKEEFKNVNDLLNVPGFGKKKMESLKGLIAVGGEIYE